MHCSNSRVRDVTDIAIRSPVQEWNMQEQSRVSSVSLVKVPHGSALPRPQTAGRKQSWLQRVLDALRISAWDRELKAREAYLAEAQNLSDLESRLRAVEGITVFRGERCH